MTSTQKQLIEALKTLKSHCMPLTNCEGCELEEVCELLFNQRVEDWDFEEEGRIVLDKD